MVGRGLSVLPCDPLVRGKVLLGRDGDSVKGRTGPMVTMSYGRSQYRRWAAT